ncbi:MAG TPA: diaminopimelate epimerase [Spirochaetota bacterium]|nr:diaminopimelate epimerase [Spirochaetota bacterium]HOM37706.1 diaminopimelate epimerase [Spirochaetota bacterium]HPQ49664.1 diaminopimelate epimerase [Spirochaetota bacterium]
MKFVKVQATGNDFILVEREWIKGYDIENIAPILCDRHFGIGSDGILIVDKEDELYKMTMLNPDGSEAMCGNGLRAFVRYLITKGYINKNEFRVKTLPGINNIKIENNLIKASLGKPIFEREKIPFTKKGIEPAIDEEIEVDGVIFKATLVSMGNPHAVIFVDNVEEVDIKKWGPKIENYPLFPKRTNVEFAQVLNRNEIIMRVWERGAGITLACGTGTAATVVAARLKKLVNSKVTVHLLGGDIEIEYDFEEVIMKGDASIVFTGNIEPENLYYRKVNI